MSPTRFTSLVVSVVLQVMSTLQGLLQEGFSASADAALLGSAWRGAEAYHFFLIAQRQLYNGEAESSLKTALLLRDYEDILDPLAIHSLLALCSSACCSYSVCSKAFIKLESLKGLTDEQKQNYEDIAMEIFTRHSPKNAVVNSLECPSCDSTVKEWTTSCPSCDSKFPVCIASGQPLLDYRSWMCSTCKHKAYEKEIKSFRNCPLCHSPV